MPMRLYAPMPELPDSIVWLNGRIGSIGELQGRTVLVHFWAHSCTLCKNDLAIVNHWQSVYGEDKQLHVIGIHTPRTPIDADRHNMETDILRYELVHPIAWDHDGSLARAFGNEHVPAYYLFDRQLQLRHIHGGERGLRLLDQRLRKLIGDT